MDCLIEGAFRLSQAGVENSRYDADRLMGAVLGVSRDKLYLDRERELLPQEEVLFHQWIERRAGREPLQYIMGFQEFMELKLKIDQRVLIPRADSETLIEVWLDVLNTSGPSRPDVLDLCTGSGALALAAGYYCPQACITATDISEEALAVARENSERLNVSVRFYQGDFLQPVQGTFDYILTNPPYVSVQEYSALAPEIGFEPSNAFLGGTDGLDFYRRLAAEGRKYLKPGGQILMEIGSGQGNAVEQLFKEKGFATRVFPDLAGRDRVVWAG